MTYVSLPQEDRAQPRGAFLLRGEFSVGPLQRMPLERDQLRVRPIATGVCGTDLSAWSHPREFLDSLSRFGATNFLFDSERPIVLGHEFTSEVLEVGAAVDGYQAGDHIFTMPTVTAAGVVKTVGYDNTYPGGLSDEVIVSNWGHIKLDHGVDPVLASVLDPVATGIEGVRRSGCQPGDVGLVTGVGPVGLGAVAEFASRGVAAIVVSDPSPVRRRIALDFGATEAVDPSVADPVEACRSHLREGSRLRVVEASGAAGILDRLMRSVPRFTVIAVMGVSVHAESIHPMGATTANVTLVFASGPDFGETRYEALHRGHELLRTGAFDAEAMVTGYAGLEGVGDVFRALRPDSGVSTHMKVLVVPRLRESRILEPEEFKKRRQLFDV